MTRLTAFCSALALACSTSFAMGQGLLLSNGGAAHGTMAGASTAVGVDAVGALFWNPAVISGLPHNEVTIGSNLLIPHTGLTSTFGQQSGRTNSDSGLIPTTALGVVFHQDCTGLSYGMSLASVAAGGVNFPGDANNPLLAPVGPLGQFILGPQAASISVLQISPTVSYQVNNCLAVGFSPMVNVSAVSFDPAFFGAPSQVNPLAPSQFPTGSHSRPFWGGGFRTGATYKPTECVTTGLSYTSPQWFETWEFNSRDANGDAFTLRVPFSLPQIFSAGVAYSGIERLLLAADLRFFDYSTTKLTGQPIREGGAGWQSIWALALGGKYQVSDRVSVMAGYLWNENPISDELALFNTMLPAITEHTLTCGAHMQVNDSIGMTLGYAHGFENTLTGSLLQSPLTSMSIDSKYDAIVIGIHIKFGGPRCRDACACPCPCEPAGSGTASSTVRPSMPASN